GRRPRSSGAPRSGSARSESGRQPRASRGVLNVEEVITHSARLYQPEHRKINVDDIFITGEHKALLRHVAQGRTPAAIFDKLHADIDAVDAGDLRYQRRFDRIGQVVVEARLGIADVFPEAEHHAQLVRLDPEEAGEAPDRESREHDQGNSLAAEIARQHGPELGLAAAQQILEFRRNRARWHEIFPRTPA